MADRTNECEICGSSRYHIWEGHTFCENGHQQQHGLEVDEDDEFGTQGKRMKTGEKRVKQKVLRVLKGRNAYRLFLQAYQHILWHQCYALIHKKGLPEELWTLVRGLWTLRLSALVHKLDEPASGDAEIPFISSSAETGTESDSQNEKVGSESIRRASKSPKLLETVAICYLGILILKCPVSLGELHRWIRTEDVPYIRAIRSIPEDMKQRLPGEYWDALDTPHLLKPDDLQHAVSQASILYSTDLGVTISAISCSTILLNYIKSLSLPLEIHPAATRLKDILELDMRYPSSRARRRRVISQPEAQLMSLLVVTVKLLFPFVEDGGAPVPRSMTEPAAQQFDWSAWLAARKGNSRNRPAGEAVLTTGSEIEVAETDVFKMSDIQLDQYLDWYQQMWINPNLPEDSVNKELWDMFPLEPLAARQPAREAYFDQERQIYTNVAAVQSSLTMKEPLPNGADPPVQRPGQAYTSHTSLESLPPIGHAFYTAAADVACLSPQRLFLAVQQTERRIVLRRRAVRRASHFGDEMDLFAESAQLDNAPRA